MGNKLLMPGMSFGHVSSVALEDLKRGLLSVNDERECVLLIAEILKKGDFTVKNLLIDLMNQTKDEAVLNLCIRLFCPVCTHEDLKKVENFRFLSSASEFAVFTFVAGAVETMSYEVVPYLLTLWEEWEDTETEVEYAIQDALDSFLNYRSIIEENARIEEVSKKSKNGHILNIDFEGFTKNEKEELVAFPGGKGEGYDLKLGSNTFIPGFEDQLVGTKKDEEKEISVKFPEEYHAKELAGKDAIFKVKVNTVKEEIVPKIDEELAKDLGYETLEELQKETKENLELEKETKQKRELEAQASDKLLEDSKVEVSHDEVHRFISSNDGRICKTRYIYGNVCTNAWKNTRRIT